MLDALADRAAPGEPFLNLLNSMTGELITRTIDDRYLLRPPHLAARSTVLYVRSVTC